MGVYGIVAFGWTTGRPTGLAASPASPIPARIIVSPSHCRKLSTRLRP